MPRFVMRCRLLVTAIASAVTLAACAGSPARPDPAFAADPVIERVVEVRRVCPPELLFDVPPAEAVPDGAVVEADALTLEWIAAVAARGALLAARLTDAGSACARD